MLRARNLEMTFHQGVENHVLKGVDLDIEEGQFVTIMGKSGSGKSTLLYLLSGLEKPTGGFVEFRGKILHELKDKEMSKLRRNAFGFVFQFFNLVSSLNVRDNILLPITMERKTSREQEEKVAEYVNMLGIEDKMSAYPHQLSGGQQQRVAIARALAIDPDIIFADEPTGNLDAQTSAEVLRAFFNLNKWLRKTIVMVTHDESIGRIFSTREVHLVNGRVLDRGSVGNRAVGNRLMLESGSGSVLEQNSLSGNYPIGDNGQMNPGMGNLLTQGTSMENYPIQERSVDEHLRILKERRRAHRLMENPINGEHEVLLDNSIEESRYEDTSDPMEQRRRVSSLFRSDFTERDLTERDLANNLAERDFERNLAEKNWPEKNWPEKRVEEKILTEKLAEKSVEEKILTEKLAEKKLADKHFTIKKLMDGSPSLDRGQEKGLIEVLPNEERLRLLEGGSGETPSVESRSIEERLRLLEARLMEARLMNIRKGNDCSKENKIVNLNQ